MCPPLGGIRQNRVLRTRLFTLPTATGTGEYTEAGALLSYGPEGGDAYRRAADFVDRLLKGAKPSDLPVEQTAEFKLLVNLKTAEALGLTVPESILLAANKVIR